MANYIPYEQIKRWIKYYRHEDIYAEGIDESEIATALEELLYLRHEVTTKEEQRMSKEPDMVNHPAHYCRDGAMETIDEMILIFGKEATMHYCLCNAWKYRARAINKNGLEDLKKSDWYLRKYKELEEDSNDNP